MCPARHVGLDSDWIRPGQPLHKKQKSKDSHMIFQFYTSVFEAYNGSTSKNTPHTMPSTLQFISNALLALLLLLASYAIYHMLIAPRFSALHHLSGPPAPGLFRTHTAIFLESVRPPRCCTPPAHPHHTAHSDPARPTN
jgi:hypothetical protein